MQEQAFKLTIQVLEGRDHLLSVLPGLIQSVMDETGPFTFISCEPGNWMTPLQALNEVTTRLNARLEDMDDEQRDAFEQGTDQQEDDADDAEDELEEFNRRQEMQAEYDQQYPPLAEMPLP